MVSHGIGGGLHIVEGYVCETRNTGPKTCFDFVLPSRRNARQRSAMKGIDRGNDFMLPIVRGPVSLGQFEQTFVGFGTTVAKKYFASGAIVVAIVGATRLKQIGETVGQRRLRGGQVQIAAVHQLARLRFEGFEKGGVGVAQGIDGDATAKIQVAFARCVVDFVALAMGQFKSVTAVGRYDVLLELFRKTGSDKAGGREQSFGDLIEMGPQERKAARDKAALIIYQVKALEKLADKGRRVLERLTTMVSNKRTSDSSKNNDKRTLQHLRNLFEQTSTDIISHRSPTATLNTTVKTRRKHSLASNSAPSLHDDTNNKTAPDGGVGLSMSVGFDQLRSTGKDSWLRQQEQHGMFAVPPLELAKRARARRAASKNLEQDIYSVDGPSEQLLHLFARLWQILLKAKTETL